jgi:tRNA dimethylallyltransferase
MNSKLIVISGPTASYKSSGAIKISLWLKEKLGIDAEIVNFDSLLFYKELNIGTAKPSETERLLVPHHMVNIASIKEPLNASDYQVQATTIIEDLLKRGKIPVVTGGSGFYLRALLKGMYATEEEDKSKISVAQKMDYSKLREKLKDLDPESYNNLHPNDEYRNRRALEYFEQTGKKISAQKTKFQDPYNLSEGLAHNWQVLHLHFDFPKEEHLSIILERTKKMINEGLVDEVVELLQGGLSGTEKPLQSIGYKEAQLFLNNKIPNLEELTEAIHISTRQLAKAQRTFFKKSLDKKAFNPLKDWSKIEEEILRFIDPRQCP